MKTRKAAWLSAFVAAALACGGPQASNDGFKQKVDVETDTFLTIADVASVSIDASLAGVPAYSGVLTYSASTGKFSGSIYLAPSATKYNVVLTAKKADGTTVIGTASALVTVTATAVATVTINISSTVAAAANFGFVITGFQATGYIPADGTTAGNFGVTVAQPAGATVPLFKWSQFVKGTETKPTPTNCNGTFLPNDTSASVTFTDATAEICIIQVQVTDAVNSAITATRSGTLGVGLNVSISGTFIPSPTITSLVLLGNGGYAGTWDLTKTPPVPKRTNEPACTLYRVDTTVAGVVVPASQTCTGVFKINSGLVAPLPDYVTPAPVLTLTAPQFEVGVTYDLGGVYDATKPPTVGLTASCPNAATNGVSLYSFANVPANAIAGSGPGTASCPAAPAICIGSTNVYWTEPVAFTAPATATLCTLTVTVNNQGSLDSFPAQVWITQ